MRYRYFLTIILVVLAILLYVVGTSHSAPPIKTTLPNLVITNIVTLEDFDDVLTKLDLGFNDFGGNMGAINDEYLPQSTLFCATVQACALRLDWDFVSEDEIFTGYFFSLFGLTDTLTTFNGTITETLSFPEHTLDLDDIDGALIDPAGARQFTDICLELTYDAAQSVQLRLELNDTVGGVRFTRKTIVGSATPQTICWDFRNTFTVPLGNPDLDINLAKLFTLVIEQSNIGDGINNPLAGRLDIHHIWFTLDKNESEPVDDQALLDLMEKRAYQYFLDWSSRKSDSLSIPQDRSTFGDLLTVGGIGFGLPAHVIAAERGWISRTQAATHTVNVLRVLDDASAFGPESVDRRGYKGWFYHFFGTNGKRKLNFDFADTTTVNEALNTVELSTIDTGLALMGVLAAQSYFDDLADPTEIEIRQRAQNIYDRVEWDFMLEPELQQFYLGWKPNEENEGPSFEIPDDNALGHYSGTITDSHTLDFYTDEALIVILLAAGSTTHPVTPSAYYQLQWDRSEQGLIRTFPGALFTYQFLPAFMDTQNFLQCDSVSWHANARQAILETIEYSEINTTYLTYGSDAWGVSAAEGPFDAYHAYGVPPVAVNTLPEQDGTVTYYGMMSAASFGDDLQQRTVSALRNGWTRGHWHPRFGLPDAFNDEIQQAMSPTATFTAPLTSTVLLRQNGPWVQRSLFAIDQGPMLLHLENARSGLIWNLMAQNPNIQRGLERLRAAQIVLEGETGMGDGQVMQRGAASDLKTMLLKSTESITLPFTLGAAAHYTVSVQYSNDNNNLAPSETISLSINGVSLEQFVAEDTGDGGSGWNIFASSGSLGSIELQPGLHEVEISVTGGDDFGVEIDAVFLEQEVQCIFLPVILRNN